MTADTHEFVLADGADAGADALRAVTAARAGDLQWGDGRPTGTYRRTWLDTFDWRLYRAGLTLEQVVSGEEAELVLTGRDGAVVAGARLAAGTTPGWPVLARELPDGPLQAALRKVTGPRALSAVARGVSKTTELQALNGDAKTVARLAVDRMALTFPARVPVPARLRLTPVRGYQSQADKLVRAITRLPGVTEGPAPALDMALSAADVHPGETPAKAAPPQLAPGAPAATAMAEILTSLLDTIEANVPGTLRDIDTEFLHDLRVAVRRTRSALKLCGDALPAGLADKFAAEFRWLGDLTTPTRDLDVFLLGYPAMAAGLTGAAPGDLEPLRGKLASSREAAFSELKAGLRSARFNRLRKSWRQALSEVQPSRKPTVGQLADAKIARALRKVLKAGRKISSSSPPDSLHNLRKRCKELRYLIEMFGTLHDPAERWQAVRELKALQDCLGDFQDGSVQRAEIAGLATEMMRDRSAPAQTLLAMGEIAAGLAADQARARAKFDGRFADFAGDRSQARLAALTDPRARAESPGAGGA